MDETTRDAILEKHRKGEPVSREERKAVLDTFCGPLNDPDILMQLGIDPEMIKIKCPQCGIEYLPQNLATLYISPCCGVKVCEDEEF